MSYNIDTWRTKEMVDFQILLNKLLDNDELEVELMKDYEIEVDGLSEYFLINGKISGEFVTVSNIDFGGVGSGSSWDDFKELLEDSKGKLIATQVWEGGDSITRITVENGTVLQEDIEL